MDTIPGVTSRPCVLHYDPGKESLNSWVISYFHYLKDHACLVLVLGLRIPDLYTDSFCLLPDKARRAWTRDCAKPWPCVSVSWLPENMVSWADLSWSGGRAISSDHLSPDGGIACLSGGQRGVDDLWNYRSLSLIVVLRCCWFSFFLCKKIPFFLSLPVHCESWRQKQNFKDLRLLYKLFWEHFSYLWFT